MHFQYIHAYPKHPSDINSPCSHDNHRVHHIQFRPWLSGHDSIFQYFAIFVILLLKFKQKIEMHVTVEHYNPCKIFTGPSFTRCKTAVPESVTWDRLFLRSTKSDFIINDCQLFGHFHSGTLFSIILVFVNTRFSFLIYLYQYFILIEMKNLESWHLEIMSAYLISYHHFRQYAY